jgi:hypothetical protein
MEQQEKPKPMPLSERVASLFIAPVKLMENIKLYPVALLPLFICLVIRLLYIPLSDQYNEMVTVETEKYTLETYERMGFTAEQIQQVQQIQQSGPFGMGGGSEAAALIINVLGIVLSIIGTAFFSALWMFVITKIARGPAKFAQYFSLFSHLTIITVLLSVAVTAVSVMRGSLVNFLSLGILIPQARIDDALYLLLTALSLPALWFNVLAVVGVKVINGWKPVKAIAVGVVSFVIATVTPVALSMLSQTIVESLNINF